ncbi:MAG: Ig-like domain-containing protein [Desulfuromonadaceae bacterium]
MNKALKFIMMLSVMFQVLGGAAIAYEGRQLASEDIILYGMGLKVEPAMQTVPKNIATIVSAYLQVPTLPSGQIPPLPADATLKGTLRGPGLQQPLDLEVPANTPFNIPAFVTPGTYSLDNIRLISGGAVLLRGAPESVTIEIIEKLLVTQVTARPLTAAEIREKGIVYDKSNFQAYNFTAAFAVEPGKEIKLDLPLLLPTLATTRDVSVPQVGLGALPEAQLKSVSTIIPDSLKLAQTRIPNLTVSGFSLKMDKYAGNEFVVPPIPGVVVIPGDIGFLNQYFSVMLMVGNVAPAGSNLVVKDLKAEIFLPPGKDTVAASSDDPLRMAMTETGEAPRIKAIVQPGPDGKLGTADDIVSLAPGESGNAEYLVEGRREGSHTVEMEITGVLHGLPIGPVTVRGRAAGTVLVRNPTFTMTFTHPDVVNAGEEYTLDVTVTNTSAAPANLVSINLHQGQIGGADLVDPTKGSQEIETIMPGDSASVSFDLRSKVSGTVFAATLDSDEHISGRFQLKTSVGELGIPLSPDSLVLPKESRFLPKTLRDAALGLLGKAYSVATAPAAALPADIRRFGKKIVWTRGIEVAQAGFRHTLGLVRPASEPPAGESLPDTALQLLYDFMGSGYSRLNEQYPIAEALKFEQDDFTGFDELRRKSVRGDALASSVASLLLPDLLSMGGGEFQRNLSSKTAYRPAQISVLLDGNGAAPPVTMKLIDPTGRVLGGVDVKGKLSKEIPFSDFLLLKAGADVRGELAIVSLPSAGAHKIRLTALPGALPGTPFSLSVVAPDSNGMLQQRVFSGVTSNDLPTIGLPSGSPATFTVEFAGAISAQQPTLSRSIPDPAPAVISVVQQADADKLVNDCGIWHFGRVVAALFSEEVTPASVQDKFARALISHYGMDDNQVVGVAMQPGNRIAFIALRDPVGPFIPRSLTFTGIADRPGQTINGQTVPVTATIDDPAAVVSGGVLNPDGSALEGAEVRLFHQVEIPSDNGCQPSWYGVSSKFTRTGAKYGWDYVLRGANRIVALDPANSEFREILFTPARNGQRLNVDIVMLGRGTLRGKILGEDGTTLLDKASIRVTSLTDGSLFGFTTDVTGTYAIPRVPVGNFLVEAVHLPTNSKVIQSGYMAQSGGIVEMNLTLFTEQLRKITISYASVNGHVLNYDGATPATGLPVFAWYQDSSQPGVRCPEVPGPFGPFIPEECAVASAQTDSTGGYSFPEIPAGSYRMYSFNQATFQEGSARFIIAKNDTGTVNILLNGGFASINGVVKDSMGNPVAGAQVGGGVSLATTAADGSFRLTDVPVGRRTLVAVSQALGAKGEATIDISVPGVEYPATILLEAQGGVLGTVLTQTGAAAAGIDVYLISTCGGNPCVIGTGKTNATGAYEINNVPVSGSEYKVSAFRADLSDGNIAPVRVLFPGQKVRTDLTFKGAGGTVKGGIWNDNGNTPLAGKVSISALRVISASAGDRKIGLGFEHTQHLQIIDTTIENNRFTFNNVMVGRFVITAAGPFSPEPVTFAGEITTSGELKQVDIRLTATSEVAGIVYAPDGATPVINALVSFKSDEFRTICSDTDPMSAVSQSGNTVTINMDALSGEQSCKAIPQGIQNLTTRSDDQGRFSFPLVNAGKFTVTVEEYAGSVTTGRTGSITSTVSPGKVTELSFRLNSRAPVKVTVLTYAGVPVPGATVKVEQGSKIGDSTRPTYKTDAGGVLMLSGADALDEGVFTVFAQSNDGFDTGGRISGKIIADGTLVEVKVYLFDHTVTVKGTVYRQDGITPVRNAEVAIANNSGDLAFAVTNANGEYSQDYIPPGDLRITIFEAATGRRGFATATAYMTTPVVTVNVSEMPIGLVKGTIYQGGDLQPLARWIVTLRQSYPSGRSLSLQGTTGLDGKFSFPGVAAGPFSITAYREGQTSMSASGNLTREGEIIDIPMVATLVKPQLGSIVGWIYHPDGSAAASSRVCLGYYCGEQTTADGDGKFEYPDRPLGRETVNAFSQNSTERGVAYANVPYAGGTGYVKIVMEGLGTVSGTVVDGGSPVSGAKISITKFPDAGCGNYICEAFTGADGRFSFLKVPAGPFTVDAVDSLDQQKKGSAGGTLSPGATADVTVAFTVTATLSLKTLYANGTPAPAVVVELKRTDGFVLYRETDQNGILIFNAVPYGSYDLLLQDPASQGLAVIKGRQIAGDLDLTGTPIILDEAPPGVTSSNPLPGEIRVPLDRIITVTFSEPVQPGSVDTTAIVLSTREGKVNGTVSLDAAGTVATFTQLSSLPLKDERQYTLSVSGVKDLLGRTMVKNHLATFTTVDITPPSILSISPDPAIPTGFPMDGVVRVLYSEPFAPSAFAGQAITMSGPAGIIDGRVDTIFGNTGLVFTPKYALTSETTYTISILPVVDLSGNSRPAQSYTVTTTDRTAPKVLGLTLSSATVIENLSVDVVPTLPLNSDVAMVDWYLNGQPIQVSRISPFGFSFTAAAQSGKPGDRITVTAYATDTSGNRGALTDSFSSTILVTADQPPAVVLGVTSPTVGGTVFGNCIRVTVQVSATDDTGVAKIGYQATGGVGLNDCLPQAAIPPASGTFDFPAPLQTAATHDFAFYVPRSTAPGGLITVNAVAVDAKGQQAAAAPLVISVLDKINPAVAFTGLSSGNTVKPGQVITAVVSASDSGGITRLVFTANGAIVTDRILPTSMVNSAATFTWTVPAYFTTSDQIRLGATAYDVAGNFTEAASVVMAVADATPPHVTIRTQDNSLSIHPGQPVTVVVTAEDNTILSSMAITGSGAFSFSDAAVFPSSGFAEKSFTINVPSGLSDGAMFTVAATATDAAGNTSAPVSVTLFVGSLASVQLPDSQLLAAGDTASLTATLLQPAPAGGLTIELLASGAIQAQPSTLVFAAGESSKPFTLTAVAGGISTLSARIAGATVSTMNVTVRGGVVAGTAVTAANTPVSGAEVVINGITVTAAADGTFYAEAITGISVTVSAYDTANRLQGYFTGNMSQSNGYLRNIRVVLSEAGSIKGLVKNADGTAAAANVQVSMHTENDQTNALDTSFTAAGGTFAFPQVQLGTYVLIASDTAGNRGRSTVYLTVSGAEVSSTVTFLGKGSINGLVRDASGSGVEGLTITMSNRHLFGSDSSTTVSASDGTFSFTGVKVGNFSLSATDSVTGFGASTTGAVSTNGQVVNSTLTLSAYGSIEGHVYRADALSPAAGVTVRAGGLSTTTDLQGYYRFEVLSLGVKTVTVDDASARSKAQATANIQTHKENITVTITLSGTANLAVTVRDVSLNPVAGAVLSLSDGYGSLGGTTDATGTAVFSHVMAGNFTVNAGNGNLHGTLTGTVADGAVLNITVDVAADPAATVTGKVLLPDGLTPAAGITVTLASLDCRYGGYCTSTSLKTDGDGGFTFASQKLYTYDLYVRDANSQLRAKALDLILNTDGQTLDRTMTMVGLGTVAGQVLMPNSGNGAANMLVTVQGKNPDFGTTASVRTNAGGYYQMERIPVGTVFVNSGDISQLLLGEASGALLDDGATLTLDIALLSNAITMPQTLYDGNIQQFDIQGDGTLRFGQDSVFYSSNTADQGGASLEIVSAGVTIPFPKLTAGTKEMSGQQLVLRQTTATVDGLAVTRKVYVPREGYFARYLEIIDNPTDVAKSITTKVKSSFSNRAYAYYCYSSTCYAGLYSFAANSTSSGDNQLSAGDFWAVIDNTVNYSYYNYTPHPTKIATVWGGEGAQLAPAAVTLSPLQNGSNSNTALIRGASINNSWDITIQPGERIALMHFLVQEPSVDAAKAGAQRLAQLPPESLAGLSQDELLAIRNFSVPLDGSSTLTAMPPLTGNITVNLKDGTGAPIAQVLSLSLKSGNPIYAKSFTASNQSGNPAASFVSNLYTASPSIGIPQGPFTVTATRTLGSVTMQRSVPGDFTAGSSTATVDLQFVDSGNLGGMVKLNNGSPVTNGTLTVLNASGVQLLSQLVTNGSYAISVLPVGNLTVKLCVPWSVNASTSAASCKTSPAAIVAGQATTADITMPATGTVRGRMLTWEGTVLANRPVTILTSGFTRSINTDSSGNFLHTEVPPGTYELSATDPASGLVKRIPVTVAEGADITQDIQFAKSGTIKLTTLFADGTAFTNNANYGTVTVSEQPGDAVTYSYNYTHPYDTTSTFYSDAANLKVAYSYSASQPNGYGTTLTAETIIPGFTTSGGTALPATLSLSANRAINMILTPTGSDGLPVKSANVTMQVVDPADSTKIWSSCTTGTSGVCYVYNIWDTGAGVKVRAMLNGTVAAETTVNITSTSVTVNLPMPFDPIIFARTLYDGNGSQFDVQANGSTRYGANDVFQQRASTTPGAMALTVGSSLYSGPTNSVGIAEDGARELVSKQYGIAGLNVTRKTYVPAEGYFARYLDILTNPGAVDVTVSLSMDSRFSYNQYNNPANSDFAVRVSSDPAIADTTSTTRSLSSTVWSVIDDANPVAGNPAVAFVYADTVERAPSVADFTKYSDYYTMSRVSTTFSSVTIPAGQSVALLNFLVQQVTLDAATASAKRLAQLPPEALSGMSAEERQMVVNFAVPADGVSTVAPLPPLNGTVAGTIKDFAGQAPPSSYSNISVTLKSSIPYYPRELTAYPNSTTGAFTFAAYNEESTYRRVLPIAPFTLKGSLRSYSLSVTSDPAGGTFVNGEVTARQDVIFTSAATVVATLTKFDGSPALGARVYVSTSSAPYSHDFSADGNVYRRTFLPAGDYTVNAELPAPLPSSGTTIPITGQLTVVAGQENSVALTFPQLGSIGGTVKNYNGLPVSGNSVTIKSKTNTNGFFRYVDAYTGSNGGAAGTFSFNDLPPDSYEVLVRDTDNWFDYSFTVAVAAGEAISRDFQYTLFASVTGKVSFRTPIAGTYPHYAHIEIREIGTGRVVTSGSNNNSDTFTTSKFAAPDPGKQYELYSWLSYTTGKKAEVILPLAAITTVNQVINAGTISLPYDQGIVIVEVKDGLNAPFTRQVRADIIEPDGTILTYTNFTGSYDFGTISSGETSLKARVTYNGSTYDTPFTLVPNGTVTATVVVPVFDGTLSGTVYAADGTTPVSNANYSIYRADGITQVPCYTNTYYGYSYYTCSTDANGSYTTSAFPVRYGEQLKMTVSRGDISNVDYTFQFPADTSAATISPVLPLFAVSGTVKRNDGTVPGTGSVSMTVNDPVDTTIRATFGGGYYDGSGNFTIFGTMVGDYSITAQTNSGAIATVSGDFSALSTAPKTLELLLEPTGSITGSVTRGGAPLWATVTFSVTSLGTSMEVNTDSAGAFSITDVPLGLFTASAMTWDSGETAIYSNTVNGELSQSNPTAAVNLEFLLPSGTVFGTVLDNFGYAMRYDTVTLTRVSDGTVFYPYTDSNGHYQQSNLTPDGYLVEYRGYNNNDDNVIGSGYGILTGGGSLRLDLNLNPEVYLGYKELSDATFKFGISSDGALAYGGDAAGGYSSPFDYLQYLYEGSFGSNYSASYGWLDQNGQLLPLPAVMRGLVYNRKIFMPSGGGYLRYLEIVENPSAVPVSISPEVYGSLSLPASGGWSYSVDPVATGDGYAIEQATGDPLMPQVGMVLQGVSTVAAQVQSLLKADLTTVDYPDWHWDTIVPAGGRACIMHFIFQGGPSDTNLEARARALRNLDGSALTNLGVDPDPLFGLTVSERVCINNFNVPPAP